MLETVGEYRFFNTRVGVIETFRKLGYNQAISDDDLIIDICDDSLSVLEAVAELEEVFDINIPINSEKGTFFELVKHIMDNIYE